MTEHDIQSTFISWCRAQRDPRLALRVTAGMCYNSITCQGSEYGGFLFESLPDSQLNTVVGKAPVRLCVPVLPWQGSAGDQSNGGFSMSEQEEWRPVVGWEDLYMVSNQGRVASLNRIDASGRAIQGRVLRQCPTRGYMTVRLYRDRWGLGRKVHHLVLEAFVGPRPINAQANHKNGIKGDNRPENLEWVSARENVLHTFRELGRIPMIPPHYKGDAHPRAKLNWPKVAEIRNVHAAGSATIAGLARQYGVSEATVAHVIKNETWTKRTFDSGDVYTVVQAKGERRPSA
jgi:hypothetical protein